MSSDAEAIEADLAELQNEHPERLAPAALLSRLHHIQSIRVATYRVLNEYVFLKLPIFSSATEHSSSILKTPIPSNLLNLCKILR